LAHPGTQNRTNQQDPPNPNKDTKQTEQTKDKERRIGKDNTPKSKQQSEAKAKEQNLHRTRIARRGRGVAASWQSKEDTRTRDRGWNRKAGRTG
jgi:hypothetical protein